MFILSKQGVVKIDHRFIVVSLRFLCGLCGFAAMFFSIIANEKLFPANTAIPVKPTCPWHYWCALLENITMKTHILFLSLLLACNLRAQTIIENLGYAGLLY